MTDQDIDFIGQRILYRQWKFGLTWVYWPDVTKELAMYKRHKAPPNEPGTTKMLKFAFCFQEEPFWIYKPADKSLWQYQGPSDLLEDLHTIVLLDAL